MITKKNLPDLIQGIRPEDLLEAINGPGDYILLEAHIFNIGGFATIESCDYSEETEKEASDNGQLYCDKETFNTLLDELNLLEY